MVTWTLFAACCALCGVAASAQEKKPEYDMGIVQLIFLVDGSHPQPLAEGEGTKLQAEHLKSLEALWTDGKALLVGPFQNAGKYRGLVALNVKTREEALDIMKKDPFVRKGIFDLEDYGWFMARNVPQKGPRFLDIEPLWFGFLRSPEKVPVLDKDKLEQLQSGHMANIQAMAASGDLVLAGPIQAKDDFRGIFIFRTKDKARIEELVAKDPLIQSGRLKLELVRWMTAKGTFPAKK